MPLILKVLRSNAEFPNLSFYEGFRFESGVLFFSGLGFWEMLGHRQFLAVRVLVLWFVCL